MTSEVEFDHETATAIASLNRDLRAAAASMTPTEARLLVDAYYTMQKMRIMNTNRGRAMSSEPHGVIAWLSEQESVLEKQVAAALDKFSAAQPIGDWLRSVYGIGPVLAAGLIAHIDIKQAPTVGHIWAFGGYDPSRVWEKGKKRPYNAGLKTLFWKVGDSFRKFSSIEKCVYGQIYRQRKEYEVARNDSGGNAETAARDLASGRRFTPDQRAYYEAGKLPPGRIDLRASRYAVKQFLADLHAVWYRLEFGKEPPLPYPIAILGHAHLRPVGSAN
jgi:Transposase IS116/IS110/IS902 family